MIDLERTRIGHAMAMLRERTGMSMREAAAVLGMSYPTISNIENYKMEPSLSSLYNIRDVLGVDLWLVAQYINPEFKKIATSGYMEKLHYEVWHQLNRAVDTVKKLRKAKNG